MNKKEKLNKQFIKVTSRRVIQKIYNTNKVFSYEKYRGSVIGLGIISQVFMLNKDNALWPIKRMFAGRKVYHKV